MIPRPQLTFVFNIKYGQNLLLPLRRGWRGGEGVLQYELLAGSAIVSYFQLESQ